MILNKHINNNYIDIQKNVINSNDINNIMSMIEEYDKYYLDFNNIKYFSISNVELIKKIGSNLQNIDDYMFKIFNDILNNYKKDTIIEYSTLIDTGYFLIKLEKDQELKNHVENGIITSYILLNDNFKGGKFKINNKVINLNKYECLTYPTSYAYITNISKILSGTAYYLLTTCKIDENETN